MDDSLAEFVKTGENGSPLQVYPELILPELKNFIRWQRRHRQNELADAYKKITETIDCLRTGKAYTVYELPSPGFMERIVNAFPQGNSVFDDESLDGLILVKQYLHAAAKLTYGQ